MGRNMRWWFNHGLSKHNSWSTSHTHFQIKIPLWLPRTTKIDRRTETKSDGGRWTANPQIAYVLTGRARSVSWWNSKGPLGQKVSSKGKSKLSQTDFVLIQTCYNRASSQQWQELSSTCMVYYPVQKQKVWIPLYWQEDLRLLLFYRRG